MTGRKTGESDDRGRVSVGSGAVPLLIRPRKPQSQLAREARRNLGLIKAQQAWRGQSLFHQEICDFLAVVKYAPF